MDWVHEPLMRKMQTSSTFLGLLLELRLSVSPPPTPYYLEGLGDALC